MTFWREKFPFPYYNGTTMLTQVTANKYYITHLPRSGDIKLIWKHKIWSLNFINGSQSIMKVKSHTWNNPRMKSKNGLTNQRSQEIRPIAERCSAWKVRQPSFIPSVTLKRDEKEDLIYLWQMTYWLTFMIIAPLWDRYYPHSTDKKTEVHTLDKLLKPVWS
jgi:sRNA-binding regulator protein Hfq